MSFLRKIWAVYGVLLFLFMMFLSLPIVVANMVFAPGERALRRNIHYLHHPFSAVFFTLIGVRLTVSGKEKLDPKASYVIVSNHRSALDFIANGHAFPGVFRFLAKQELQKIPVFGWIVKKMCLIVDRSSAMSRARSVVLLKNELQNGMSIFVYPEGGRNATAEPLAPFFDGAFRVALQTKAPIAVQTILNVQEISNTAKSVDLWPGKLNIVWDTPIPTENLTADDLPKLKEQVIQLMLNHLAQA